jgi:hypothetical protein
MWKNQLTNRCAGDVFFGFVPINDHSVEAVSFVIVHAMSGYSFDMNRLKISGSRL